MQFHNRFTLTMWDVKEWFLGWLLKLINRFTLTMWDVKHNNYMDMYFDKQVLP